MASPNPLILSLNLQKKLFVTKLVPTDSKIKRYPELMAYQKANPIPNHHTLDNPSKIREEVPHKNRHAKQSQQNGSDIP